MLGQLVSDCILERKPPQRSHDMILNLAESLDSLGKGASIAVDTANMVPIRGNPITELDPSGLTVIIKSLDFDLSKDEEVVRTIREAVAAARAEDPELDRMYTGMEQSKRTH